MLPGIEYALGSMLCFGLGDLIYKRGAAAGAPPHQLLMVQSWVFLPTVALYGMVTGSLKISAVSMQWGALTAVFALTGFYNFAHSMRTGLISVNAPIFRLSFILTATLAILLLGERLTPHKLLGIALALAAVWLLLATPIAGDDSGRRENRSSLMRVLIATVAVGVCNFIYKIAQRTGISAASLISSQAIVVIILATGFTGKVDGASARPAWRCHTDPEREWRSALPSRSWLRAWRARTRAWWLPWRKWDSSLRRCWVLCFFANRSRRASWRDW